MLCWRPCWRGCQIGYTGRMEEFHHLPATRKTGNEPVHDDGRPLPMTLLSFWQWSASDLVSNALRGRLAEYLVAGALGVADGVRVEWDAYDLRTAAGLRVEVKSAAYLQSWQQRRPSTITFGIQPTFGWDAATNMTGAEQRRQADVYVFALLEHQHKRTLDPLNVAQWTFYVLPTTVLNTNLPTQKTIRLAKLLQLGAIQTPFAGLARVVEAHAPGM